MNGSGVNIDGTQIKDDVIILSGANEKVLREGEEEQILPNFEIKVTGKDARLVGTMILKMRRMVNSALYGEWRDYDKSMEHKLHPDSAFATRRNS